MTWKCHWLSKLVTKPCDSPDGSRCTVPKPLGLPCLHCYYCMLFPASVCGDWHTIPLRHLLLLRLGRYSGQKLKANIAMPPLCPPRMTSGILPFPLSPRFFSPFLMALVPPPFLISLSLIFTRIIPLSHVALFLTLTCRRNN